MLLCQELRNPFHNSLIPAIHRGLAWHVPRAKLAAARVNSLTQRKFTSARALVLWCTGDLVRGGGTKTLVIWYWGYRNGGVPIHCDTGITGNPFRADLYPSGSIPKVAFPSTARTGRVPVARLSPACRVARRDVVGWSRDSRVIEAAS